MDSGGERAGGGGEITGEVLLHWARGVMVSVWGRHPGAWVRANWEDMEQYCALEGWRAVQRGLVRRQVEGRMNGAIKDYCRTHGAYTLHMWKRVFKGYPPMIYSLDRGEIRDGVPGGEGGENRYEDFLMAPEDDELRLSYGDWGRWLSEHCHLEGKYRAELWTGQWLLASYLTWVKELGPGAIAQALGLTQSAYWLIMRQVRQALGVPLGSRSLRHRLS